MFFEKNLTEDIIQILTKKYFQSENDKEFCKRVWNTDLEIYANRLKAIEFVNKENVLDAGFGMFQWTYALSALNKKVYGIEIDVNRYRFAQELSDKLKINNVELKLGTIEQTNYPDNFFDAVFSYSVIMMTNVKRTLQEFYRILKSGGVLYFNSNGLGWYLYNLLNTHNNTSDFSSQKMAIETLKNTLSFFILNQRNENQQIITPSFYLLKILSELNFKDIKYGGEGTITLNSVIPKKFFQSDYLGEEAVFEFLVKK